MSDNVFKPQKPMNPVGNLPPDHPLVANNQESLGGSPEGGVQLTGNVPEALLKRMQNKGNPQPVNENLNKQQVPYNQQVPYAQPAVNVTHRPEFDVGPLPPDASLPPSMKMSGGMHNASQDLQNLLQALQSQSNVFEEITLPSLGRFYDGTDGPTDGKIHIRPMTGEEEQILATPRFVKKGQAMNMIFSRCIQEPYRPENLLSVDRTFVLIYLRGISYGNEYEVEIKDPDSDSRFSTVIDLNSLPVETCPLDFGPVLSDTLPQTGLTFTYRLSRGRDETELQDHRERRRKQFGDGVADDTLIFRTAQLTESIANITAKEEIQVLLKNLPVKDIAYIRSIVNDPPFGVDTNVTILSPASNEEFEVALPMEANFFFPRHKRKSIKPA